MFGWCFYSLVVFGDRPSFLLGFLNKCFSMACVIAASGPFFVAFGIDSCSSGRFAATRIVFVGFWDDFV